MTVKLRVDWSRMVYLPTGRFGFDSDPGLHDLKLLSCTWAFPLCILVLYGELINMPSLSNKPPVSIKPCQQIFPNWSMSKVSPSNSHGLTVKLTVWAVNSRCHDLASKSDSETETFKIAGQVSRHDPLHWNDDLWFLLITKFVNKFLFSSVNYRKLRSEQSRQLDWTKFLFSDFSSSF